MGSINWKFIAKMTGYNIINPSDKIENIIEQICASEKIIAAAMHGAIMADICRVPWIRLKLTTFPYESILTSETKWTDWLHSMNIYNHCPIAINNFSFERNIFEDKIMYLELLTKLKNQKKNIFYLSDTNILEMKLCLLNDQVNQLRKKYG
ncbi:MAG: hypothetical protein LUH15_05010 [Tannerellaceae bacterium]|nr:hypothetical protein [Tannerellaceae bacterium]